MMIVTFLLLIIPLINLTTSQIPNPSRYRVTIENAQRYAVDKIRWRMRSKTSVKSAPYSSFFCPDSSLYLS
jgi:hypothetical protein